MTPILLILSFAVMGAALLVGFVRMIKGPSVVDRILAFDAVVLCAVGFTVLLSRWWQTDLYMELILIISSLGFFGTVAFVFFLQRNLNVDRTAEPEADDE
jgi:multisubunit Na+/H+ antiporter MnhF subunit